MGICEDCAFLDRATGVEPCKSCDRFEPPKREMWEHMRHVSFAAAAPLFLPNKFELTDPTNQDPTNQDPTNPEHYKTPGPEVIELTRHMNFNRGNAVKYLCRAGKKQLTENQEVEDLKKAIWYIEDEIQRLTGVGDHAK